MEGQQTMSPSNNSHSMRDLTISMLPSNDSSAMQELTISGLFGVLKHRRSFIVLSTLFCVSMAILLCIVMTPKYKATGEIQVAKQSSDELGLDGMKGDGGSASDALT